MSRVSATMSSRSAVLAQPNYGLGIELLGAFVLGLLVIAFAPNLGPVTLVAVGALFASVLVGTSWYFYKEHRLLIDFTYPLMSTTAIYLTLIFSSFVREQAQRRQIAARLVQHAQAREMPVKTTRDRSDGLKRHNP